MLFRSAGLGAFHKTYAMALPAGAVVTATATHPSGNTSEFSRCRVVINSSCRWVFDCPRDINVDCQSPEGALVNYPMPIGTNFCSGLPLTWVCLPPPGWFRPGSTLVQCWGSEDIPGGVLCAFVVTVASNCPVVPPCLVLQCPTNLVVPCEGPQGASVRFSVTASNVCQGEVSVSCIPPSGSVFEPGVTTVNCTAVGSGQTNQCSFTVTVTGNCAPRVTLKRSPNGLLISWPALAEGYIPQQTTALGPGAPVWTLINDPIVRVGDQNQMSIKLPSDTRFYQLVRPLTSRSPVPKPASTIVE